MPEDERVRQSQGLPTPGQGFIKASKAPRAVRYMRGKATTAEARTPPYQVMTEADAGVIEKDTDRMLEAKEQEQQPAADRRRQYQGRVRKTSRIPFKIRGNRAA